MRHDYVLNRERFNLLGIPVLRLFIVHTVSLLNISRSDKLGWAPCLYTIVCILLYIGRAAEFEIPPLSARIILHRSRNLFFSFFACSFGTRSRYKMRVRRIANRCKIVNRFTRGRGWVKRERAFAANRELLLLLLKNMKIFNVLSQTTVKRHLRRLWKPTIGNCWR